MANRAQLYKYKGNRCGHCGLGVDEIVKRFGSFNRVFEFNHIDPGKKHPQYDNLIQRVISKEQLDEVDKCVLLCRICHGVIHAQNITGQVSITVRVNHRSIEQRFKGQFLSDFESRKLSFFTDDEVLFLPYIVNLGSNRSKFYFGRDLKAQLAKLILETRKKDTLFVRDLRDKVLLRASNLHNGCCELEADIRFHLMQIELWAKSGEPDWFVRNGVALGREGKVISNGCDRLSSPLIRLKLRAETASQRP